MGKSGRSCSPRESGPSFSLVTAPRITVFDGGSAQVQATTDMPYQAVEATTQPNGKEVVKRVTKSVEDGLRLEVTAKASKDHNDVRLTFKFELQRVLGFDDIEFHSADGQPIKAQGPVVQEVSVATVVSVGNGETLCLGGQTISPRHEADPAEVPADSILLILVKPVVISRPDAVRSVPLQALPPR